jgi:hypothetical protein
MLPIVLLGLVVWIAVSVSVALLFVRILNFGDGESFPASAPDDVELDRVDLALPIGAGVDRPGGADQVAGSRRRVRA